MDRTKTTKTTIFTALVIAVLCVPTASAQATAANITIISGSGQMPCPTCGQKFFRTLYPLVVRVTDASGNPIAGKTVNWQVTFAPGVNTTVNPTAVTDTNGVASTPINIGFRGGTISAPYLQSAIVASVDSVSTTFTVTSALTDLTSNSAQLVFPSLLSPTVGDLGLSIGSGPAGSTATVPIHIHVDVRPLGVPNVSLRLVNADPKTLPSATCATQPGADPGSVLTDANGDATCNAIFGPIAGNGAVNVLVGGLDPAQYDYAGNPFVPLLTTPLAYFEYDGIHFTVTPVTAALVQVSSGNNQTLNPGQASAPLVVKVTDSTGSVGVGNTNVTFSVSPAIGATLSAKNATTDSSGLAQTTLTLSPTASGQFSVTAALASNPSVPVATFTVNTNVQITSLAKVSGDAQTVQANQSFAAPLVVQVNGNNGAALQNVTVNFSISGPGTLTSNSALTDGSGRALTGVKAGSTAGTVTVVASAANISQTFTLTVIPQGPALTTGSFLNAAGRNSALSPCSLVTATATGLAPGIQGLVLQSNSFGPWLPTLAGDTVSVNGVAAPIYSLGTVNGLEQITFQVPCEAAVGTAPVTINVGAGTASANIVLTAAGPGIFETLMSDGVRRAVAVRPDGSFVSLQNPARSGESIRVYVTGMGPTTPAVSTGTLPVPGSDSLVTGQVIVGLQNAGTRVITARLSPNLIGVYEVAFQVPSDAPTGNDIVLSVAVNVPGDSQTRFSNGSRLPLAK